MSGSEAASAEAARVWRRDGGFVTAEAAVVLPVLVLFAMGLVWALLAAAAQIQCVDAARAGARAAARQDPEDVAIAAAKQAAPPGARVTVQRDGDLVRVEVVAQAPGPDALTLRLRHEAVALAEETVGQPPGAASAHGAEPPPIGTFAETAERHGMREPPEDEEGAR